jgi:hypothetical protein
MEDDLFFTRLASLKMRLANEYAEGLAEYNSAKPRNYQGYDYKDHIPVFSSVPVPPPPVAPRWRT